MAGVEVYRADGGVRGRRRAVRGRAPSSIPMAQVFARYAKDMLETQTYPEVRRAPNVAARAALRRHAPGRSACCSASTTSSCKTPLAAGVQLTKLDRRPQLSPASVDGQRARASSFDYRGPDAAMAINRLLKDGARVALDTAAATASTRSRASVVDRRIARLARRGRRGSRTHADGRRPRAARARRAPSRRRASRMYSPWTGGNMDEGWTRWVLEQYEFNARRRSTTPTSAPASCASKFDAIILPDQSPARSSTGTTRAARSGRSTAAASATRASPR